MTETYPTLVRPDADGVDNFGGAYEVEPSEGKSLDSVTGVVKIVKWRTWRYNPFRTVVIVKPALAMPEVMA